MAGRDPHPMAYELDDPPGLGGGEDTALARAMLDGAAVAMVELLADGTVARVNQRFAEMVRRGTREITGRPLTVVLQPEDRHAALVGWTALADRRQSSYVQERRYVRPDGRTLWAQVFGSGVRDEAGRLVGILEVTLDITERKLSDYALRQAHRDKATLLAEMETLLNGAPIGFAFLDREARYVRINPVLAAMNRRPPWDHLGRRLSEVVLENGSLLEAAIASVFETGEPVLNIELGGVGLSGAGDPRTFLSSLYPVRQDGEVAFCGAVVVEISEQKRQAERLTLLLAELDHRVKNTLAKVQSVVTQTRSQAASLEAFSESLEGRIQSMARTHGLLIRSAWEGAMLAGLVEDELAPYRSEDGTNVRIAGPEVALLPTAAMALGLALHELATNAAKYGALSTSEGRVEITWTIQPDGAIGMDWRERGGPPVHPPGRRGFGTTLVERSLAYELGGSATLEFRAEGLSVRIRVPATQVSIVRAATDAMRGEPVDDPTTPAPGPVDPKDRADAKDKPAAGRRLLIVEDSALIALDLQMTVEAQGFTTVGPIGRLDAALEVARTAEIDGAILDVNLDGEDAFPVADLLLARGLPVLFSTGYDKASVLPERYRTVPVLQKPFAPANLRKALRATFG